MPKQTPTSLDDVSTWVAHLQGVTNNVKQDCRNADCAFGVAFCDDMLDMLRNFERRIQREQNWRQERAWGQSDLNLQLQ